MRPIILITRPIDDARDFCRDIAALGWRPVAVPLLRIVPLSPAAPHVDDIQAIVFTSINAVRHALELPFDLPVYCVGDRTADVAREAGFLNVVSAAGDIGDLERALIAADMVTGSRILHICGADVVRPMNVPGVRVVQCIVYRAEQTAHLPFLVRILIRLGLVDTVSIFSARTGQAFVDAMKKAGLQGACSRMRVLCLSDSVVQSVSMLPWRTAVAARYPDRAAMLELI